MPKDKKDIGYFSIGIFILIGIFFIVTAIVILGSKTLFQNVIYVETYFNESVQGLSDGSPVKYLGMDVGRVVEIVTVKSIYPVKEKPENAELSHYIYVKMAISPRAFNLVDTNHAEEQIKKDVDAGLRVKLAIQGLTGNAYLELDFVDTKTNVPIPIYWQPENYYIPSIPSTLAYFSDSVQYLLEELRKIDMGAFFGSIRNLADTTKQTVSNTDRLLVNSNRQIMSVMTNLQIASENLKSLSERAKAHPAALIFGNPPAKLDLNKL
jgi:paraquat-inducible protein B